MKDLSTPSALKVFTATSGDDGVFTASATNTAAASTFQIEVLRTAERHKFASAEFLDTDVFGGKKNDALTIQVGANAADIMTCGSEYGFRRSVKSVTPSIPTRPIRVSAQPLFSATTATRNWC